ncbi:alpha-amylase family glycosyl hydrolase [Prochlorococcus sp. MIT 1341]|uniref:alpha-amylase family glycosyl hydrolase n=1 Tax=Prochlorococcus sp. MIT 1341 TaxID=3096221 RepID=UPI002A750DDD|nr:alpha-amylase family glycosyl hydrolase [Prochlorococcus sp. MIT 1341]
MSNQLVRLKGLIEEIYKNQSDVDMELIWSQMMQILESNSLIVDDKANSTDQIWDSSTAVLITYPDPFVDSDAPSLRLLANIINSKIENLASVTHVLPFLKATSDGGFAPSSHEELNARFGNWSDLGFLGEERMLMADLVLNHVSSSHPWVDQFRKDEGPGKSYILSPSLLGDWSNVVRPRNSSLFSTISTIKGPFPVWTTFSPDQIDLNWQDPFLLIEFLKLIVRYANFGVKWIRLDAVGFIWKESGTKCIHLDQAHQLVQIFRVFIEILLPRSVLVTETNVPQDENLSYLDSGLEANIAYNFPLPPLILEALMSRRTDLINNMINEWPKLPANTTLLNFTACHDGVGLRPLYGIMDDSRLKELLIACEKRGGMISHRSTVNGQDEPYEINISWWSAMSDTEGNDSNTQLLRFLLSQLLVMSLKGVPAFYFQALLASENDISTFRRTGQRRDLNRRKFPVNKLIESLQTESSIQSLILENLKTAMLIRSKTPAFHPDSSMQCLSLNRNDLVIVSRGKDHEKVIAVHNFTEHEVTINITSLCLSHNLRASSFWKDILSGNEYFEALINIDPYSVAWLKGSINS